jgi:hypothetical protein
MSANVKVDRLTAINISNDPCPSNKKLTHQPGFLPKNFVATLAPG